MKFECGKKARLKREAAERAAAKRAQWHPWFAWHRVKVGTEDCRWLETVERRRVKHTCVGYDYDFGYYEYTTEAWEYRPLVSKP